MRKIIHLDMDAFYASVEQRDDPRLRGRPVVVGWDAARGVVCAASYEARRYGVRSAMPVSHARRLCPDALFVPPDFTRYRAVASQLREIFTRYTPLVEPLSLDEAYLDVSANLLGFSSATATAEALRAEIRAATALTASAGVAPNKFLAKIASDWRKPDGLFVIRPQEVSEFLKPLPVEKVPGVGKATARLLEEMGVKTLAALREVPVATLVARLGKLGVRLNELAHGIDERPVVPDRPVQSISTEQTFERDLGLEELPPLLPAMAEQAWAGVSKAGRVARTVVLKLKTDRFRLLTRSLTPAQPPASAGEVARLAGLLLARAAEDTRGPFRLAGVGLSNFVDGVEATSAPQSLEFDFGSEDAGAQSTISNDSTRW